MNQQLTDSIEYLVPFSPSRTSPPSLEPSLGIPLWRARRRQAQRRVSADFLQRQRLPDTRRYPPHRADSRPHRTAGPHACALPSGKSLYLSRFPRLLRSRGNSTCFSEAPSASGTFEIARAVLATLELVPCIHEAPAHVIEDSDLNIHFLAHRSPRVWCTSGRPHDTFKPTRFETL